MKIGARRKSRLMPLQADASATEAVAAGRLPPATTPEQAHRDSRNAYWPSAPRLRRLRAGLSRSGQPGGAWRGGRDDEVAIRSEKMAPV